VAGNILTEYLNPKRLQLDTAQIDEAYYSLESHCLIEQQQSRKF